MFDFDGKILGFWGMIDGAIYPMTREPCPKCGHLLMHKSCDFKEDGSITDKFYCNNCGKTTFLKILDGRPRNNPSISEPSDFEDQ